MLSILRSAGMVLMLFLGVCAALSLGYVLLNNIMLLWAGLAVCSLAFALLLIYLSLYRRWEF